jgi:thioesterase domain-containing protein
LTPRDLLALLREGDVYVSADGDKLRINAPEGALSPEMRELLVRHKLELLTFLAAGQVWSVPHPSIVPLQKHGWRAPFFGVPGHNGDVFAFARLAARLGPEQPFYALEPPGLDEHRTPLDDVERLGSVYADQLCDFRPEGSFLIGGYCMGGTIAFETARQLLARGRAVALLALFGSPCPTSLRPLNRLRAGSRDLADRVVRNVGAMGRRPPAEWPGYVTSRVRGWWSEPDSGIPKRTARRREGVEQATLAAVRRYHPLRYPGKIVLFVPNEAWRHSADRPMDWRDLAAGGLEILVGAEDNNGDVMLREPHVEWTAEQLRILLLSVDRAAEAAPSAAARG